jgi:hypothetical protein
MQATKVEKGQYHTETEMVVKLQESLRKASEQCFLEIETSDGHKIRAITSKWIIQADRRFLPGEVVNDTLRVHKTNYSFRVMDHVFRLVYGLSYDPILYGLSINEVIQANGEVMEALEEFRLTRIKPQVIEKFTSAMKIHCREYLKSPSALAHLMIFAAKWDPNGELERYSVGRMLLLSNVETNALVQHLLILLREKL